MFAKKDPLIAAVKIPSLFLKAKLAIEGKVLCH
jgi:hypothetical protein